MQSVLAHPADYYVVLAAILGALVWLIAKSGSPFPPVKRAPKTRRDELIEARDYITQQINILKSPIKSYGATPVSTQSVERFESTLRDIEEELRELS